MRLKRTVTLPSLYLKREDLTVIADRCRSLDAETDAARRAEAEKDAKTYYKDRDERRRYVERTLARPSYRYRKPVTVRTRYGSVEGEDLDRALQDAAADGIRSIRLRGEAPDVSAEVDLQLGGWAFLPDATVDLEAESLDRLNAETAFYERWARSHRVWWRAITGNFLLLLALAIGPFMVIYGVSVGMVASGNHNLLPGWILLPLIGGPIVALVLARISPPVVVEGLSPSSWLAQHTSAIVVGVISGAILTVLGWVFGTVTHLI